METCPSRQAVAHLGTKYRRLVMDSERRRRERSGGAERYAMDGMPAARASGYAQSHPGARRRWGETWFSRGRGGEHSAFSSCSFRGRPQPTRNIFPNDNPRAPAPLLAGPASV